MDWARTAVHGIIVLTLCGLWHGAAWHFVLWGLYESLLLVGYYMWRALSKKLWGRWRGNQDNIFVIMGSVALVLIFQSLTGLFFRAPDMPQATRYWGAMLGFNGNVTSARVLQAQLFAPNHVVVMLLGCVMVWQSVQAHEWVERLSLGKFIAISLLFVLAIINLFTNAFSPFLYFQF